MTPQGAFEYLNRMAGIAPTSLPQFEGNEAQLPTPFRAATAAAAALGFAASAAGEIWRLRGGDKQAIAVELAAAATTLNAAGLVRRDGKSLPQDDEAVTGFFQSGDGRWLRLHGGPHAERLLDLLNANNDAKAVMEGVAKWNGLALEDALAFMQLCGAVVRSEEEWRLSPQGRLLGAPIVLRKIGAAPPLRLGESPTPLAGLRVLDVSRMLAGPYGAQLLASHGAEVLAVRAGRSSEHDVFSLWTDVGKRKTVLDLIKPADAEALRRLAREADLFVDSNRPGAMARLGFSPASLAHIAPGMIYVSISAFGTEGPWASRRGFEDVAQAATGLTAEQGAFMAVARRRGHHDVQPELLPGHVLDTLTGQLAAAGAVAALIRRIREGGSWLVQTSLAATAAWLNSLGRIDTGQVPLQGARTRGMDAYLRSCETEAGRLECLGPVVRMSKTPPLWSAPGLQGAPRWTSSREELNAAEVQSA
jgi:hypothetical protein